MSRLPSHPHRTERRTPLSAFYRATQGQPIRSGGRPCPPINSPAASSSAFSPIDRGTPVSPVIWSSSPRFEQDQRAGHPGPHGTLRKDSRGGANSSHRATFFTKPAHGAGEYVRPCLHVRRGSLLPGDGIMGLWRIRRSSIHVRPGGMVGGEYVRSSVTIARRGMVGDEYVRPSIPVRPGVNIPGYIRRSPLKGLSSSALNRQRHR